MAATEHLTKEAVERLIARAPRSLLEALDETRRGLEGLVSVFSPAEGVPVNMLVVRWGQKDLGLGNIAYLEAGRLTGLDEVLAILPRDRGPYEVSIPFWAAAALGAAGKSDVMGAEAIYALAPDGLSPSPVGPQCEPLTDFEVLRPMFPKIVEEVPAYVLSLRGALTAVAVVTHLQAGIARVFVYTIPEARRRGFGRGVLSRLASDLVARGVQPTARVDLSAEDAVRMVENTGFHLEAASLKVQLSPRSARDPGLVQIGRR